MRDFHGILAVVAFAVVGCGGARGNDPTTESSPAKGDAGCDLLRERLTTVTTRLAAVRAEGRETAAKYHTIGDVMGKLSTDLDVKYERAEVSALASDYRAAAKAIAEATHEVAGLLEKLEEASDRITKTSSKRYVESVQKMAATCKASTADDCVATIDIVRSLGEGKTTSSTVEVGRTKLAAIKVTTKGLKPQLGEVAASLGELRDALKVVEETDAQARAKISAYERAAGQLKGLNERGDAICPAAPAG